MKPTALIVDDEPLARQRLRDLVNERSLVEVVGEAADGEVAVRVLDELQPDLVFLDVEMPGATGLQVLERTRHRPIVIFTTAYDRYAVAAFELAAADYLLKPFGSERFHAALERALRALAPDESPSLLERAAQTLSEEQILERVFVRDRGRIVPLRVADIERCEAHDDYVAIHAGGRSYLISVRLQDLEARLGAGRFLRVHRSHLVNLEFVKSFEPHDPHRLVVVMRDGTRLIASRARSRELRELSR